MSVLGLTKPMVIENFNYRSRKSIGSGPMIGIGSFKGEKEWVIGKKKEKYRHWAVLFLHRP
jgi:hypothetical protein